MKVCIYGAGAVGGEVAARLIHAGVGEISLVARGAHLAAIRERGLTLRSPQEEITVRPVAATDDPARLPAQDLVIVALKSHQLAAQAQRIAALLAPQACAAFITNGITWWWNHGLPGGKAALPLLDPDAALWTRLRQRALGGLVYTATEVVAPGVVEHKGGYNRWVFGEPDNSETSRLHVLRDLLRQAGLMAEITTDIRREVWGKLFYNCCHGPVCSLARLPVYDVQSDPGLRAILERLIRETVAVAAACGWPLDPDLAAITEAHPRNTGVRPSMFQDVLAGRPMEVDALLGQTQLFARERGVPTPTIDVVVPLLRGLDRSARH